MPERMANEFTIGEYVKEEIIMSDTNYDPAKSRKQYFRWIDSGMFLNDGANTQYYARQGQEIIPQGLVAKLRDPNSPALVPTPALITFRPQGSVKVLCLKTKSFLVRETPITNQDEVAYELARLAQVSNF